MTYTEEHVGDALESALLDAERVLRIGLLDLGVAADVLRKEGVSAELAERSSSRSTYGRLDLSSDVELGEQRSEDRTSANDEQGSLDGFRLAKQRRRSEHSLDLLETGKGGRAGRKSEG
jgi:hypothetical protein